ncbi:MAG: RnfABCDGE type electron transport complex subunit G [Spirochaetes bacterium]|nr:RnfABCDGE type electron transport complex subunit G [Spirochaetota bacterium]
MIEYVKMIVVLSAISAVCGFGLARISSATKTRIEEQKLLNVKGPAVKKILAGSGNNLIADRKEIVINDKKMIVFIGKKNGVPWALAYEMEADGFGGEMNVMMGFNLSDNTLTGVGVTSHKETPGVGSRVTDDSFTGQFKGKESTASFKVKADGGVIDVVTGASVSSRGVCDAVQKGASLYRDVRAESGK